MSKLFKSVMFDGHDLLMRLAADNGASGGGSADDDDDDSDGDEGGDEDNEDGDEEDGEEDDEDADGEEDDDHVDDLDAPLYSKREVSKMISGRLGDQKKQFANHDTLNDVARMIGDIIGSTDVATIQTQLKAIHAAHQAKAMGMTPQAFAATQQANQVNSTDIKAIKRRGVESEFDNSFIKDPKFADASLFREQIIDLTEAGFTMTQAYWSVMGEMKVDKKASAAAKKATQLAQHNASKKKSKQVTGGSSGKPKGGKPVHSEATKAMAASIGMDVEEYVAWGNITTLDQAQAIRGKKK